jgi:hypothetical protein
MLDDRRDCELLDRRRVGVQRLDLDLEAGVRGSEDPVAAVLHHIATNVSKSNHLGLLAAVA